MVRKYPQVVVAVKVDGTAATVEDEVLCLTFWLRGQPLSGLLSLVRVLIFFLKKKKTKKGRRGALWVVVTVVEVVVLVVGEGRIRKIKDNKNRKRIIKKGYNLIFTFRNRTKNCN
ncbi:hypothetical protein Pfo_025559 [Paulownia fortunei]|nr:hypothetical protein Pfo_025559 [Paulownia fortunei]